MNLRLSSHRKAHAHVSANFPKSFLTGMCVPVIKIDMKQATNLTMIQSIVQEALKDLDELHIVKFLDSFDTTESISPECNQSRSSKHIRFSRSDSMVYKTLSRDDLSTLEKSSMWWSQQELEAFRYRAIQVAAYTRNEGQSFITKTIVQSLVIAANLASSSNDDASMSSIFHDPSPYAEHMISWCQRSNARRGLERFVVNKTSTMRGTVSLHRKHVLRLYKTYHDDELAAQMSQNISRGNRLFARLLGYADAAILQDTQESHLGAVK
jgi:hypothetical protein